MAGWLVARWLGAEVWVAGGLVAGGCSPQTHTYTRTQTITQKKKSHLFSRRALGYKVFGKNGELLPKFSKTPGGASCLFLSTLILLHIMATQNCDPPHNVIFNKSLP